MIERVRLSVIVVGAVVVVGHPRDHYVTTSVALLVCLHGAVRRPMLLRRPAREAVSALICGDFLLMT